MNAQQKSNMQLKQNPVAMFAAKKFSHPAVNVTYQKLLLELGSDSSPQIILLTGPTGVGKSTVAAAVGKKFVNNFEEQMAEEPDFVPVVALNATPPTGGNFNWKDFYIRLLSSQNEPLVDRKLYVPKQMPLLPDSISTGHLERSVTDHLRRSVEEYLRRRRTRLLIIDEAHHLLLVSNRHRLECQFETLKALTIETGVTILLCGTYDLLNILRQSGQLTRRSQVINFPRYDMRDKEDVKNFKMSLRNLERDLSEFVPANLIENANYFYRKSAGCIGILKDWLTRCLEHALSEKASVIDAAFADRFALPNRGVMRIAEEAFLGEAELDDVDDAQLLDLLQRGVVATRQEDPGRRLRPRPGQRSPKRDVTGGA